MLHKENMLHFVPSLFLIAGEVTMSRNGSPPTTLMHVDHTLTLWAFFDIYGSTQKIRVLGSSRVQSDMLGSSRVQSPVGMNGRHATPSSSQALVRSSQQRNGQPTPVQVMMDTF